MNTMIVLDSNSRGKDIEKFVKDCIKKYGKVPTEIVIPVGDTIVGKSDIPILEKRWALNGFVYLLIDGDDA